MGADVILGDWRLFFLINTALAGIGALLILRILADDAGHKSGENVDYAGIATFGFAILALIFALDVAPMIVLLAIGSVISGCLYEKVGPKRFMITGYVLVSAGAASIAIGVASTTAINEHRLGTVHE